MSTLQATQDIQDSAPAEGAAGYRMVWRWHFYAGLLCLPFIAFLALTGGLYLFKPQIEAWQDRAYDHLALSGPPVTAAAQAAAAVAAVPGSRLRAYQLPQAPDSAAQVIVDRGGEAVRVYVRPESLAILKTAVDEDRLMRVVFRLHGELLMGNTGSAVVELAASWAVVMLATGLYLWWPRSARGAAGVLYPRLSAGSRTFWRDLHAVTGIWISAFALFLLLTGLPWAKVWGSYLKEVRQLSGSMTSQQDWTIGAAPRRTMDNEMDGMEHMGHGVHMTMQMSNTAVDYTALDKVVATVQPLALAYPVLVSPPASPGAAWGAKSDAQNRTLRVNLTVDGATGAVLSRKDFKDKPVVDRMVGIGVAAHEGQLFGWPNQLLGLITATGLVLMSVSSAVLWWGRRKPGVLGAPVPTGARPIPAWMKAVALGFALYLPLFTASLLFMLLLEKFVLRRMPAVSQWLGLEPAAR